MASAGARQVFHVTAKRRGGPLQGRSTPPAPAPALSLSSPGIALRSVLLSVDSHHEWQSDESR